MDGTPYEIIDYKAVMSFKFLKMYLETLYKVYDFSQLGLMQV